MASLEDVADLPVMARNGDGTRPLLGDVATVDYGTTPGEVERYNMQRVVSLTANVHGEPLGEVVPEIRRPSRAPASRRAASRSTCAGRSRRSRRRLSGLRTGCCCRSS